MDNQCSNKELLIIARSVPLLNLNKEIPIHSYRSTHATKHFESQVPRIFLSAFHSRAIWFWILGWFFTILALLGNGLVVYLVISKRRLRTTTNWFIVSLAVADFFAALAFLPPRFVSTFYHKIDLTHAGLWYKICFTFFYCSTTNLCVLTVDRYIAIVKPLKYASFRESNLAIRLIPLAWFTTLVFFTLPACLSYRENATFTLIFETERVFLFQVFPCIFFVLVTCLLIGIAKKISRRCAALEAQVRYNYASRQAPAIKEMFSLERKAAAMIILIITIFNVTYAGASYVCFCFIVKTCVAQPTLKKIIYLLFIVNVTANPIVYAYFKEDIKKNLLKLLENVQEKFKQIYHPLFSKEATPRTSEPH